MKYGVLRKQSRRKDRRSRKLGEAQKKEKEKEKK